MVKVETQVEKMRVTGPGFCPVAGGRRETGDFDAKNPEPNRGAVHNRRFRVHEFEQAVLVTRRLGESVPQGNLRIARVLFEGGNSLLKLSPGCYVFTIAAKKLPRPSLRMQELCIAVLRLVPPVLRHWHPAGARKEGDARRAGAGAGYSGISLAARDEF